MAQHTQNGKTFRISYTINIYNKLCTYKASTQVNFILWQNPALIGNLPPHFSTLVISKSDIVRLQI